MAEARPRPKICNEVLEFYTSDKKWQQVASRLNTEMEDKLLQLPFITKSILVRSCFPRTSVVYEASDPFREQLRAQLNDASNDFQFTRRVFTVLQAFLQHMGILCQSIQHGVFLYSPEAESGTRSEQSRKHSFASPVETVGDIPLYVQFVYRVFDCFFTLGYDQGAKGLFNLIRDMILRSKIHPSQLESWKTHFVRPALNLFGFSRTWSCQFFSSRKHVAEERPSHLITRSLVIQKSDQPTEDSRFEVVPICNHQLLCSQTMNTIQVKTKDPNAESSDAVIVTSKTITLWRCPFADYNSDLKCEFEKDCLPKEYAPYFP